MASLGDFNFTLTLTDKDFNAKISEALNKIERINSKSEVKLSFNYSGLNDLENRLKNLAVGFNESSLSALTEHLYQSISKAAIQGVGSIQSAINGMNTSLASHSGGGSPTVVASSPAVESGVSGLSATLRNIDTALQGVVNSFTNLAVQVKAFDDGMKILTLNISAASANIANSNKLTSGLSGSGSGSGSGRSSSASSEEAKTKKEEIEMLRLLTIISDVEGRIQKLRSTISTINENRDLLSAIGINADVSIQKINAIIDLYEKLKTRANDGEDSQLIRAEMAGVNKQAQNSLFSTTSELKNALAAEKERLEVEKAEIAARKEELRLQEESRKASVRQAVEQNKVAKILENVNHAESRLGRMKAGLNANGDVLQLGGMNLEETKRKLQEIEALLEKIRRMAGSGASSAELGSSLSLAQTMSGNLSKEMTEAQRAGTEELRRQKAELVAYGNKLSENSVKIRETNKLWEYQKGLLSDIKGYIGNAFNAMAIGGFLKSIITIGGEFEKQRIALGGILQSEAKANKLYGQLKGLAVQSPFTFQELSKDARQLSAFSIPYSELYDTTKRLADLSAGLGVSVDRLILAYGQVRSASVLRGQELRQFTEAGVPMVDALAKKLSEVWGRAVSTNEVFDAISKKQVPFKMVRDVLFEMTDEGGNFYNMQEKMADSIAGKWSNLTDAWQIMLSEIADSSSGFIKSMIGGATTMMKKWQLAIGVLGGIVAKMAQNYWVMNIKPTIDPNMSGKTAVATALSNKNRAADNLLQSKSITELNDKESELVSTRSQLTDLDVKALVATKQLTREQVVQAAASGKLTYRQVALINSMGEFERIAAKDIKSLRGLRGAFNSVKTSLNSFANSLGNMIKQNLLAAAIGAITSAYTKMKDNASSSKKEAEEGAKALLDYGKSMRQVMEEMASYNPQTSSEAVTVSKIKDLEQALRNNLGGSYAEKIIRDAYENNRGNINGIYSALFQGLQDATPEKADIEKAARVWEEYGKMAAEMTVESFGKNYKEAAESYSNLYSNTIKKLTEEQSRQMFDEVMEVVKNNIVEDARQKYGTAIQNAKNPEQKERLTQQMKNEIQQRIAAVDAVINSEEVKTYQQKLEVLMQTVEGSGAIYGVMSKTKGRMFSNGFTQLNGYNKGKVVKKYFDDYADNVKEAVNKIELYLKGVAQEFGQDNDRFLLDIPKGLLNSYMKQVSDMFDAADPNGTMKAQKALLFKKWFGITPEESQEYVADVRDTMNELQKEFQSFFIGSSIESEVGEESSQLKRIDIVLDEYKKAKEELPRILDFLQSEIDKKGIRFNIKTDLTDVNKLQAYFAENAEAIIQTFDETEKKLILQTNNGVVDLVALSDQVKNSWTLPQDQREKILQSWRLLTNGILTNLGGTSLFSDMYTAFKLSTTIKGAEDAAKKYNFNPAEKIKTPKTKKSGSKSDKDLEEWRKITDAIKKAIDAYEKWSDEIGSDAAYKKITDSPYFKKVVKGITIDLNNPRDTYDQILNALKKKGYDNEKNSGRFQFFQSVQSMLEDLDRKDVKESTSYLFKTVKQEMDDAIRKYELFHKYLVQLGDEDIAIKLSFVDAEGLPINNKVDLVKTLFEKAMGDYQKNVNSSWDKLSYDWFATNVNSEGKYIDEKGVLQTLPDEVKAYFLDAQKAIAEYRRAMKEEVANIIASWRTSAEKIAAVDKKLKEDLDKITEDKELTDSQKTDAQNRLMINADLEKFRLSDEYFGLMNRTFTASYEEIAIVANSYIGQLKEAYKNGIITRDDFVNIAKQVKEKDYEKMLEEWGLLSEQGLGAGMEQWYNPRIEKYKEWMEDALLDGSIEEVLELDGKIKALMRGLEGIKQVISKMSALADITDGLCGIMNNFGLNTEEASEGIQGAFSSFQSGWKLGENLTPLTGPWGAVVGGMVSLFSDVWSKNFGDALKEKQIEHLKKINESIENQTQLLKDKFENTLGGLYGYQGTKKQMSWIQEILYNATGEMPVQTSKHFKLDDKNMALYRSALSGAINDGNYFDTQLAALYEKRTNLALMYDTELSKKNWDGEKLDDFQQQIKELDLEIENFVTDMAKSLYSIDFKSWASQLGDALVDAWANGEDAAESYEKTVKDLLNSVTKSIISQSIIETALQPILDAFKEDFINKKGKLNKDSVVKLANDLMEVYPQVSDAVVLALDTLRNSGLDLSESTSSSLSGSISSITEQTADILASYLNAIRDDVSVIRAGQEGTIVGLNEWILANNNLSAIAQNQLTQLNYIADNTSRSAKASQDIYDLLYKMSNGTESIYTR